MVRTDAIESDLGFIIRKEEKKMEEKSKAEEGMKSVTLQLGKRNPSPQTRFSEVLVATNAVESRRF